MAVVSSSSLPPLWHELTTIVGIEPGHVADVSGPRWWWGGPLDVEGLALGSVQAAATGLAALTGRTFGLTSDRVAASFGSLAHLRIDGRGTQGFAPLSRFHRVRDGWVRLHANYPHHVRALFAAMAVDDADALRQVLPRYSATEVEERVHAAGGAAAAVRAAAWWDASPMGRAAAAGPWIRFTTSPVTRPGRGWAPPRVRSADPTPVPLHGLRVLDLTRVIAGPSASRLLGALGADVLRVDPPARPELWDHHIDTGFCKRSVELDVGVGRDRSVVSALLAEADVVLLGYRDAAMRKFGLDAVSVHADHPEKVVVSFDAWGDSGPWAQRRGFDSLVQAACGIADRYADADGTPGRLPVQAIDHATGFGIVAATAALLAARQQANRCGLARLSLARTARELTPRTTPSEAVPARLDVPLRTVGSDVGTVQFVPPPLTLDGAGVEYHCPPVPYGSSRPAWRPS